MSPELKYGISGNVGVDFSSEVHTDVELTSNVYNDFRVLGYGNVVHADLLSHLTSTVIVRLSGNLAKNLAVDLGNDHLAAEIVTYMVTEVAARQVTKLTLEMTTEISNRIYSDDEVDLGVGYHAKLSTCFNAAVMVDVAAYFGAGVGPGGYSGVELHPGEFEDCDCFAPPLTCDTCQGSECDDLDCENETP